MSLDIDIIIFIAFLVTNLVVGLAYGREVKTISDYSLGGRNFSTGALVSTIVATCVTGSGFFIILTKTYSYGLYYFIPTVFIIIQIKHHYKIIFIKTLHYFLYITYIFNILYLYYHIYFHI